VETKKRSHEIGDIRQINFGRNTMYKNNINALRFIGAFLVLYGHTFALCYGPGGGEDPISEWLKPLTGYQAKLPGIGVAMFFVMSGYLVTQSYCRRPSLLAYLEARALRIYPALWATLLLTVFVIGPLMTQLTLNEYFSHKLTWNYLFHNAGLYPDVVHRLPGVFIENPRSGGINGSLWTLPVEVRMYFLVAILGVSGVLGKRIVFNVEAVSIVVFYLLAPDHFFLLHKIRHERLGLYFLIGALAFINRQTLKLHGSGVLILFFLVLMNYKNSLYNAIFAIWFSYLTLYIAFHPRLHLPDLASRGDFSYGLYLYAFPMTQVSIATLGSDNPWLILATTFLSSMMAAVFSWFVVESPCLRLKGRLLSKPGYTK
jgi:peptidoglycan/LPS O-acetylase OafA/YrhL